MVSKGETEKEDLKFRHQLSKGVNQNNYNIYTLTWHLTPAMASKT